MSKLRMLFALITSSFLTLHSEDINTRDLGQVYSEESTRRESGIQSVTQPEMMEESTFAFTVPQPRERVSPLPEPLPEPSPEPSPRLLPRSSPKQSSERPTKQTLERSPEPPAERSPEQLPEQQIEHPTQEAGNDQAEQVIEDPAPQSESKPRPKKEFKISRHGIPYPSLPVGVVKKLATTFVRSNGTKKPQLSKETLEAVIEASDWFFEQVSDDLGAYASHAGRRMINESDMITLMKRCVYDFESPSLYQMDSSSN